MPAFQDKDRPGGSNVTAKMLKGVAHPSKIKCSCCNKIRNKDAFSNRQLSMLSFAALRSGNTVSTNSKIKCRQCTGGPVTELKCSICEDIKGLEEFSKAQRKDPDKARCLKCVQMHLDTEPGVEPPEEVENVSDDESETGSASNPWDSEYQYHYEHDQPEDSAASLTMDKLTISQDLDRSRKSSMVSQENIKPSPYLLSEQNVALLADDYTDAPSTTVSSHAADDDATEHGGDGGWITQPRRGREVPGAVGTGFVGYDPHGIAHPRVRAPSTVVSSAIEPSMRAPKPVTKGPTKESLRAARWAKVKAPKPKTPGGIYAESNYGQGQGKRVPVESDDEEDDDDDYMKAW